MLRTVTALGILLFVAPVSAAEVQCSVDDEARVAGTDQQVWVSLEDGIHVIDPAAEPGSPGSVEAFCDDHVGLVAIVIPAPKPSPDDDPGGREAEIVAGFLSTAGAMPHAQRGAVLFADAPGAEADSVQASGDGPADTLGAPVSETAAADGQAEDLKLGGCSAQPGPAGPLAWVFALVALALRRRGRAQ